MEEKETSDLCDTDLFLHIKSQAEFVVVVTIIVVEEATVTDDIVIMRIVTDTKIDAAIVAIRVIAILASVITITEGFYVTLETEASDSNKSTALKIVRSNEEDVDEQNKRKKDENEHIMVVAVRQLLVAYFPQPYDDEREDMEALEQLARLMLEEVVSTISAIHYSYDSYPLERFIQGMVSIQVKREELTVIFTDLEKVILIDLS